MGHQGEQGVPGITGKPGPPVSIVLCYLHPLEGAVSHSGHCKSELEV